MKDVWVNAYAPCCRSREDVRLTETALSFEKYHEELTATNEAMIQIAVIYLCFGNPKPGEKASLYLWSLQPRRDSIECYTFFLAHGTTVG